MLTVGKLQEVCARLEKEYGSDAAVCIQIYDTVNRRELIAADHALDYGWSDNGTLYITNSKDSEKDG